MRNYRVDFTNSDRRVYSVVSAPDLIFAGMKGLELAKLMMEKQALGNNDWTHWRVIIETEDEGRLEKPFPLLHVALPIPGKIH
jgi:hypothetical protein